MFVDSYYKTINTRVVLSNLIIWNVKNMSPVTSSAHETLNGIKAYTRDVLFGRMNLKFDNTQLMIYQEWGSLAGLGTLGSICSPTSAAVSRDIMTAYTTANTIAREMGHNIGFSHFNHKCSCASPPCVMDAYNSYHTDKSFASCTQEYYEKKLSNRELPCLLDYPGTFFRPPTCGNGLLEANETCDCGTEEECNASGVCCNYSTCELKEGMDCATGPCCDRCKFKARGILCRDKLNTDCDTEEYCTGTSHNCPQDQFLSDGRPCNNDTSYCYQGMCTTHDTACEFLWGENAKMADDSCFNPNAQEATEWAGCGKNSSGSYIQCENRDKLCGKLQCRPKSSNVSLPRFPLIGSARGKRTVIVYKGGGRISCIQGRTSVSPDMGDPTVAPDGVKCGNFSMCIDNKCVPLRNDNGCDPPCKNGGLCTYERTCLCKEGFLPPSCEVLNPTTKPDTTINTPTTLITSTTKTTTSATGATTNLSTTSTTHSSSATTFTTDTTTIHPTPTSSVINSGGSQLYWLFILMVPVVVVIVIVAVELSLFGKGINKVADVSDKKDDIEKSLGPDNIRTMTSIA